jgi:hypothetical protein
MNSIKRAGVCVRVSTVEQETDLQEHEPQDYCERRGWSYGANPLESASEALLTLPLVAC